MTSQSDTSFVRQFKQSLASPGFWLAFLYFFFLLSAYYLLRPVREEMGIRTGVDKLQWLYTGTFFTMLFIIPIFGWLKDTLSRRWLVVGVHLFFVFNLCIFYWLFSRTPTLVWPGIAFFIWISVFNMFAVSVFWSLMADILTADKVKLLFAPISAGGSLGGIIGSLVTATLVGRFGIENIVLLAAVLLCGVVWCAHKLCNMAEQREADASKDDIAAQRQSLVSMLGGLTGIFKSGYLSRITVLAYLYTVIASLLYFVQAHLVEEFILDSAQRTQFFALINLLINGFALLMQLFATSIVVHRFGIDKTYGFAASVVLFAVIVLGLWPMVISLAVAQVTFRAMQFGAMKPCYEMFFSATTEEQKYKSKNVIDTAIVRAGDISGAWFFTALLALGLSLESVIAVAAIGVASIATLGVFISREFSRRISATEESLN